MLVYEFEGRPWQTDMHMYFFAVLASLAAYCDYRPIVAGTVAVALHHLMLNFIFPAAVYSGGSDLGRVVLHAVIVVVEASILIWVAHTDAAVRGSGSEDSGSRGGQCGGSTRQCRTP